jgi:ATP-dependent 26S proteasome regulatory subunit
LKKPLSTAQKIPGVNIYISKRFQQVVALHILKNLLKRAEVQVPLLLGIHGPSGEGKTFQCEQILKNMGVKRFLISGGQLDNHLPGQASHLVRTMYIRASESIRSGECSMAVVLINDVDTGLGRVRQLFDQPDECLWGADASGGLSAAG